MDEFAPPAPEVRASCREELMAWLDGLETAPELAEMIDAVVADEDADLDRWFVRVRGEAKDIYSIWFELDQRTLRYETFVMPAPEENHAVFFEQLLTRNDKLRDVAFAIGAERGIYLKGRMDIAHVTTESLDRVLGSIATAVEQSFQPALRLGFASRFPA